MLSLRFRRSGRFLSVVRDRRGSSAVELALTAPILLLLVFAGIDYGGALVEDIKLTGAARAGAQVALLDPARWQDSAVLERAALEEYMGHRLSDTEMQSVPLSATSTAFCACTGGAAVACGSTCTGGTLPGQFVRLSLNRDVNLTMPYPWEDDRRFNVVGESVVRVK